MPLRAAVVFHGKLGSLDRGTGAATRAVDGAVPGLDMLVMCYATLMRNVIQPNLHAYAVDIITHSWNPPVGEALDSLYRPRASAHEPEQTSRNRALCFRIMPLMRELAASTPNGVLLQFEPV